MKLRIKDVEEYPRGYKIIFNNGEHVKYYHKRMTIEDMCLRAKITIEQLMKHRKEIERDKKRGRNKQ